jgi:predicted membrane-bound spermidine synthase
MKEGLIKDAYELIIKEIQTSLTVAYIIAVGIGMLFQYQYYSEFGINIFDFADVFEFLIAPFADFRILFFSVASMGFSLVLFQMDTIWKRKFPKNYSKMNFGWDKKPWFNTFRSITFSFLFLTYLYLTADKYGAYASNEIIDHQPITLRFIDNEIISGVMIGNTTDIIFLLRDNKVTAIPMGSMIKEFDIN